VAAQVKHFLARLPTSAGFVGSGQALSAAA
jgi:hypothetical protein